MSKKIKGAGEISAETLFKKYKKQLIKQFGKKALYNDQLDNICTKLFGSKYLGTHPQDQVVLKPGYQIINVDTSKQSGSHWVGIYQTQNTVYIYDSFGRPSSTLLKILTKKLNKKNIKFVDSDNEPEQFGYISEICGQLCISFLMVVKELGVKRAILI